MRYTSLLIPLAIIISGIFIAVILFKTLNVLHFSISAMGISFLFALISLLKFLNHRIRVNITILLITSTLAIYSCNLLLYMSPLQHLTDPKLNELYKRLSVVEDRGIDWDTRSIHEVINNLNDQGIDAYPAAFPQDSFNSSWIQEEFGTSENRIWPLSGI